MVADRTFPDTPCYAARSRFAATRFAQPLAAGRAAARAPARYANAPARRTLSPYARSPRQMVTAASGPMIAAPTDSE